MRKKGFTLIELLAVIALIGVLVGIGGVSIKKQSESKAMLRVQNEIGDFFRVAAKRSQETGRKYAVEFKLEEKIIEISRNGEITDILKLPNVFEYGIKDGVSYLPVFNTNITSSGNISDNFTLYIAKSNSNSGIQGGEEVKYAISFYKGDSHVKYLHVREYISIGTFKVNEITGSPSINNKLKLIKN